MAISAATVWEVRITGNDSNGGGFVAGASGTDFSQQDAAQYTFADLASANGTAANPQVTSASHNFVATDVGNIMQITAGLNWTPGFYQIQSVAANAATLDRACGSVAGLSSGTFAVGGALISPGKAGSGMVAGNTIFMRTGTYSITSASANVAGGCLSMPANASKLIGYGFTRADGTKATMQASGIATFTLLTVGASGVVENIIADGANLAGSRGMLLSSGRAFNCVAKNCVNSGFVNGVAVFCEATNCATGGVGAFQTVITTRCIAHDNITSCVGFNGGTHTGSIAYNNNGSGFDNFPGSVNCINCTSYNNAGDGFNINQGAGNGACFLSNCLAYGNTGFGVRGPAAESGRAAYGIFLGSNTAGATTGTITIVGQTNLTANPFTNAAGGDFSLNTAAGGGAAVRGAGVPGSFPLGLTAGFLDGGAVQHLAVLLAVTSATLMMLGVGMQ